MRLPSIINFVVATHQPQWSVPSTANQNTLTSTDSRVGACDAAESELVPQSSDQNESKSGVSSHYGPPERILIRHGKVDNRFILVCTF